MTELSDGTLDFVIAMARVRAENKQGAMSSTSKESVAIFDELDSLTPEEFGKLYMLYLVGSGDENNFKRAQQRASADKFEQLESMAQDLNLHVALTHGMEILHRTTSQS